MKAAERAEVPVDLMEAIGLVILAHHGPNSDSPVDCLTPEALVVHLAFMRRLVPLRRTATRLGCGSRWRIIGNCGGPSFKGAPGFWPSGCDCSGRLESVLDKSCFIV